MNHPPQPTEASREVDLECNRLMLKQRGKGMQVYKTPLATFNGRDQIEDAAEEATDEYKYTIGALMELRKLREASCLWALAILRRKAAVISKEYKSVGKACKLLIECLEAEMERAQKDSPASPITGEGDPQ